MPTAKLKKTHSQALSYIRKNDEIEPGPFLHVANDLISIAKGGFENEGEMVEEIKTRIKTLAASDKIPAAAYGRYYGWNTDIGMFSFGSYSFEPDEKTKPLIEAMKNAQIAAFNKSGIDEARRLLGLLRKDLQAFGREFSGYNGHAGYHSTAILHKINAGEFANAVFGYVTSGNFDTIGAQLRTLADRHRPDSIPEELAWANKVETILSNLAEEARPLEKARMIWFLGLNWKIPSKDEDGT